MQTYINENQSDQQQLNTSNDGSISQNGSTTSFVDKRPKTAAQRQLQNTANNSPQIQQATQLQAIADKSPQQQQAAQLQALATQQTTAKNQTGLPNRLKSGMENLSGLSLDDVKVHRNSDKPAQLQAHAYAQGSNIYLGPGQEKQLPHELGHVVQQKRGGVKPTMQLKGDVAVNDDQQLEKEADTLGQSALQGKFQQQEQQHSNLASTQATVVQRSVDPEIDVHLTGHASPVWGTAGPDHADELNLQLSRERVHNVETLFRELFNTRYAQRGNPSFSVNVEEAANSISTEGVGSSVTLEEAEGDRSANEQRLRRVDIATRVLAEINGMSCSSVPTTNEYTEDGRSTRWAVRIQTTMSGGLGAAGGGAYGEIKNLTTGQVASGFFVSTLGGVTLGAEAPLPVGSVDPSWTNFETVRPMTFEELNNNRAALMDISGGGGVIGYSWAYFTIDGMVERAVPVGGFVMNEYGAGVTALAGTWTFNQIPPARTITEEGTESTATPFRFTLPELFEHQVYFPTEDATIDDQNRIQLELYVDYIISRISHYEEEYADTHCPQPMAS